MNARTVIMVFIVIAFLALTLAKGSYAEQEPNNGKNDAEELSSGDSSSGTLGGNDTTDWYYVELGPYEKVEVTLELTSVSGGLWVYEIFEDDEDGGVHININVDPSYRKGTDSYKNDEMSSTKLYLRVAGDGEYRIAIKVTGENICCLGSLSLVIFPLLILFGAAFIMAKKAG